ncbi:MAG TPA: hypothetical protein DEG96_02765 [Candidatus Atribacteria bacterium]|nr:hypothetical protein [Candidatus Atribacteria bacterium]
MGNKSCYPVLLLYPKGSLFFFRFFFCSFFSFFCNFLFNFLFFFSYFFNLSRWMYRSNDSIGFS